ncbi:MAG TPA: D-alanine--D-alanine ligase [Firmicutes bacterium]|nr:D-alanine--D-alanine ligase [Bacillota bacterium]
MKKKIAVLYGGRSGEHEVSVNSAAAVIENLAKTDSFEILPVFINKEGVWQLHDNRVAILADPAIGGLYILDGESAGNVITVDVVFPVLHGTYGEDGTLQGLLELARLPYVGAGVTGSAVGMDKIIMKAVLRDAGLPVGEHLWFTAHSWQKNQEELLEKIQEQLGFPCFVKPANLGSSVGITKAYSRTELIEGIADALQYDRRILVEKFLGGREIECSVLGNDEPAASVPGEIVPCNDFYDYNAKYIDTRSELIIPAELDEETSARIRKLAVESFLALDCAGMARVDFFVAEESGRIWINELNTIPGFTSISMYPKLWEASGLPFPELLYKLVTLAEERAAERARLKTTYSI